MQYPCTVLGKHVAAESEKLPVDPGSLNLKLPVPIWHPQGMEVLDITVAVVEAKPIITAAASHAALVFTATIPPLVVLHVSFVPSFGNPNLPRVVSRQDPRPFLT